MDSESKRPFMPVSLQGLGGECVLEPRETRGYSRGPHTRSCGLGERRKSVSDCISAGRAEDR